jgi:hypothetical protein
VAKVQHTAIRIPDAEAGPAFDGVRCAPLDDVSGSDPAAPSGGRV